jgi:hypothetical protein
MIKRFAEAKSQCQQLRKPYVEVFVPDFGSVRVSRFGMNRGGERGQHFEFRLSIAGATIGLSPRSVDRREVGNRKRPSPNICLKQTGRGCLLVGAVEANERAEAFISVLGGEPIELKISRGDLCLDIVNLSAFELHDLVREGHFITDASHVRPAIDYLTNEVTGFYAGKAPLYLTVYDKVAERMGKVDQLYNRALIDRRWHGHIPRIAARIEYQLRRPWLLDKGISTPRDFLERRGSLGDTLTKDWFRITQRKVDRRNKHQSRAKTHPLWIGIQQAFEIVFGPSEGFLPPIKRNKITPIELAAQARGCLAACLLQMGVEVRNYKDFARKSGQLMLRLFPKDEERLKFLQEFDRRKMEFETT